eukprot:622217-Prorocentrum_minimum.AAC.1
MTSRAGLTPLAAASVRSASSAALGTCTSHRTADGTRRRMFIQTSNAAGSSPPPPSSAATTNGAPPPGSLSLLLWAEAEAEAIWSVALAVPNRGW